MQNKKLHFFTVLLILAMSFMTIATSVSTPPYRDRLNYETRDDYLYIKINPAHDPNEYIFLDGSIEIYFRFDGNRDTQEFINNYSDEQYTIKILNYNIWWSTNEEINMDEPLFNVYIENDLVILKLNKSLIKDSNFRIGYVYFRNAEKNWYEKYE